MQKADDYIDWVLSSKNNRIKWLVFSVLATIALYIGLSAIGQMVVYLDNNQELGSYKNSVGLHELVLKSSLNTYNHGIAVIGDDVQAVVKKCGDIHDLSGNVLDRSGKSYKTNLVFDKTGVGDTYEAMFIDCLGKERNDIGKLQYGIILNIAGRRFIDKPGNHWYYFSSDLPFSIQLDEAGTSSFAIEPIDRLWLAGAIVLIFDMICWAAIAISNLILRRERYTESMRIK